MLDKVYSVGFRTPLTHQRFRSLVGLYLHRFFWGKKEFERTTWVESAIIRCWTAGCKDIRVVRVVDQHYFEPYPRRGSSSAIDIWRARRAPGKLRCHPGRFTSNEGELELVSRWRVCQPLSVLLSTVNRAYNTRAAREERRT